MLRGLPGAKDPEVLLRYFEFHLLRLTGVLPELYQCVECGSEIAPGTPTASASTSAACYAPLAPPAEALVRPLSLRAMKVLRLMHRGSLAETAALTLNPSLSGELKSVLSHTVRYWLGKEIRSDAFLEQLGRST